MKLKNFTFDRLNRIIKEKVIGKTRIPDEYKEDIGNNFIRLSHEEGCYIFNWMGIQIFKYPTDLMKYQEIIFEQRPDILIECGTAKGGSALFFANLFDLLGNGKVVSIDVKDNNHPYHNRIKYLIGKSTDKKIVEEVKKYIAGKKVMVILDSDHYKGNVLKELKIYGELVSTGYYMIVEDTILNGNTIEETFGAGPKEAVEEFMKNNNDFEVDKSKEAFILTSCKGGFLRKIKC